MSIRDTIGVQANSDLGKNFKDLNWWDMGPEKLYKGVVGTVDYINQNQAYRSEKNKVAVRLYGNMAQTLDNPLTIGTRTYASTAKRRRLSYNLIKSAADTVIARLAKNEVRPTPLTKGGDFDMQLKAKRLDKFLQGAYYEGDYYREAIKSLFHACLFGLGALKTTIVDKQIKYENVLTDEIKVDDLDGMYGTPRSLYQVKQVDKQTMMALYPEHADAIKNAKPPEDTSTTSLAELITVIEAWRLPSVEDGDDGLHAIVVDTCTLMSEPWKRKSFPFAFIRWTEMPTGFYGLSLVDEALDIQLEINQLCRSIQDAMRLLGSPKMILQNGSQLVGSHINNDIGTIVKTSGEAPIVYAPAPINPAFYDQLERLWQRGFEQLGISQMNAAGTKPAGLNSAPSLREFNDIQSERFYLKGKAFENLSIDTAYNTIAAMKELKDYEVRAFDRKTGVQKIKWSEIDLKETDFVLQIMPTSALPDTPAARTQQVIEWLQGGLIDNDYALELLKFPDTDSYADMRNAPLNRIKADINDILEKGMSKLPRPYYNLALAKEITQYQLAKAEDDGVPEDRLELLVNYLNAILALEAKAQMAMQPQQPLPTDVMAPGITGV